MAALLSEEDRKYLVDLHVSILPKGRFDGTQTCHAITECNRRNGRSK